MGCASSIKQKGVAEKLNIDASGASDVNTFELKAKVAESDASVAGSVNVTATETLKASVIQYKDLPK